MKRPQQQTIVLVVLVGVMIAVYVRALHRPSAPSRPASAPRGEEPHVAPAVSLDAPPRDLVASADLRAFPVFPDGLQQRQTQRTYAARLGWGRDPFAQDPSFKRPTITLTLTGILWDPNQPMAIINGQTLSVGQELDGYRVTAISLDRVFLTHGNHTLELSLGP